MNGLEATEILRKALPQNEQPYIIVMTANSMADDRERWCLERGMDDYIPKPVNLKSFEANLIHIVPETLL